MGGGAWPFLVGTSFLRVWLFAANWSAVAAVRTVRTHVAAGGAPKQLATVPYRDLLIFEGSAAFGLRCFHGVTILLIKFVSPSLLICFMIVYF